MTLTNQEFRLLKSLIDGTIKQLTNIQSVSCLEQAPIDAFKCAIRMQRMRPALVERMPHTEARPDPQGCSTHWRITMDGYLHLMEVKQQQDRNKAAMQRLYLPDGAPVLYRILPNAYFTHWGDVMVVQLRFCTSDPWRVCATGMTVASALKKAQCFLDSCAENSRV